MHKLTFFPLGNADTCLLDLECGKKMLFDFAHWEEAEDGNDLRIDLAAALRDDLENDERDSFDVVAFTHLDDDHIHGASDFFYLEHAKKYQAEERIKIKELWVPAAAIVEEGVKDEANVIRAEARHRLRQGQGIRVFSRPDALKDWLENEKLDPASRQHLITDAGQTVPGFTKQKHGVEFFVHSPFAKAAADGSLIQRNQASLVMQASLLADGRETKLLLSADTTHEIWSEIVGVTCYKKRESRLAWDIFKLLHHCSYTSLAPEKGKSKTTPVENVQWLLEQGRSGALIISSSDTVPGADQKQPPHFQAAAAYKETASNIDGEFVVTMEHPKKTAPDKLIVEIGPDGATRKKEIIAGGAAITGSTAPRAGMDA